MYILENDLPVYQKKQKVKKNCWETYFYCFYNQKNENLKV